MKLVWGNSFDGTNNYKSYEKKLSEKETGKDAVQNDINNPFMKINSLSAQKMEQKRREAEDKMLEEYRRQIMEVENSGDDDKVKAYKIDGLNEKIKQIEDARAQREQEALKLELEKKKAEAEKKNKTSEKSKNDTASDEQEVGIKREDIEGMVKISVSVESIRELKRTKAMLKSEAKQLEIDINNDFGISKHGRVSTGHETPRDFKHKQLNKLNSGVSGLESSISSEVRKMAEIARDLINEKTDASKASVNSKEEADDSKASEKKIDDNKEVHEENPENAEKKVDISL